MPENDPKESSGYSAPIIYKAFSVLQEVAKHPDRLGTSELARNLNFNKSTVYGILQALLDLDVLCQDEASKKFHLGPGLIQLGNQALAGVNLRSLMRPYMENLSQEFGETVFLGTFDEYGITIIEKADSPLDLKITAPIGARIPLFAGAPAKAFLAHLHASIQRRLIEGKSLPKFTGKSVTSTELYIAELQQVRQRGYATDFEEYIRGVHAVSVPLLDRKGRLMAALWIVGFASSFDPVKMEKAAAAAISATREIALLLET